MNITPEMARAELQRRRTASMASPSKITPEMARTELERRKGLKNLDSPQEEGFLDYAKRGLARGARNAAAGAIDTLDFLATPVREGLNLGAKALGSDYKFKPLGEEVAKGIDTLTGGYTSPQNPSEKTSEAIGRALGSMPSGLGLGLAAKGIKNAPQIIESTGKFLKGSNVLTPTNVATSGATSGLIQSSLNQNPENVGEAIGAGVAGGVGIPLTAGLLSTLTKKGRQSAAARTGEFFNVNPQAVETFEKAGITPMLADVSKSSIPKTLTSKLENLPFSAKPIREAKDLQRKQVAEGLGQGEYGRNLSKKEGSELVTKGAKNYQKGKSKDFSKRFSKVENDIEKLSQSGNDMVSTAPVDDFFKKEIFDKFKDPLQEDLFRESPLGKQYIKFHEAARRNGGNLPYYAMKDMIDTVRDKITTFGEIGDISQGRFKKFASTLEQSTWDSLEPKFKALGDKSYKNWKEVRKDYAQYAQEEIPKLNEIYKKDKKGATDAFIDLMSNQKKGGEKVKIALQGLSHPDQMDLMDAVNKNLGAKSDGTFSPLVWVRKYKSLEPDAKKALLSPLNKSSQEKVNYIAESIDKIKETLEKSNTSATAYHNALGSLAGALGTAVTVGVTTGNIVPAAALGTGLFLQKLGTEKILTNPKFINWMYKGMKAKDLDHFQRNLNRIPKVGKLTKTLQRSVQTFQHDLDSAQKKEKDKE